MTETTERLRVPEHVYRALGYLFPRLMFLNARYAPQVHWGDIAAALDGFPADDLDLASAGFWNLWRERWTALAEEYTALAEGSGTTAGRGRALRGAAAAYHWAEFQYFDDRAVKQRLRQRIRDCFLGSLAGTDLEVTEGSLPGTGGGYWVLRTGAMRASGEPLPAVVLSNGLDSATEVEVVALAEAYLERGIAAVLFEGPGQGSRLGRTPVLVEMERVVAELLERLRTEPGIAADRLAFAGISFGGYLALRVARELGEHFRCVVNFGGGPAIAKFDGLPRRLKDNFRFAFDAGPGEDLQPRFDELAVEPGPAPATEVLSVSGALDDIFPVEGLYDLDRAWSGQHTLEVHPREAHTSLNLINSYTLRTADLVTDRLAGRA
ncbi:alpha/beta hydrolase family protein [Streptomyces sp. 900105755]